MTPALTIPVHFLLSYLSVESSALYNMIHFTLALSLCCNHVSLKPSSVGKFIINLSIHNFIFFLILHLFLLMIEEYQKGGCNQTRLYILKERPSPQYLQPASSFFLSFSFFFSFLFFFFFEKNFCWSASSGLQEADSSANDWKHVNIQKQKE